MTKRRTAIGLGLAVLALCAAPLAAASFELSPASRALTLARVARAGEVQVVRVVEADAEGITAVPLGAPASGQALDALAGRPLEEVAADAPGAPRERFPWAVLLPAVSSARHIAAGTNYVAHADEVEIEAPFVFPKLVAPETSLHRLVVRPEWLLDYEVEVAVVFDRDVRDAHDLAAARAGLFVVNDFTDRATLIREVDLTVPDVGGGFANAKGQPGFLPTGPFVVVASDWRALLREIEIRLTVNGAERQRAAAADLIWDVDEIARRSLALEGKPHWEHAGHRVTLIDDGIPKGMAILTGTPGGVVFNAPTGSFIARGVAAWLFGLHFVESGATDYVKERLIDESRDRRIYLEPGDEVVAEARWLGRITTTVAAPGEAQARIGGAGTPAAEPALPLPPARER